MEKSIPRFHDEKRQAAGEYATGSCFCPGKQNARQPELTGVSAKNTKTFSQTILYHKGIADCVEICSKKTKTPEILRKEDSGRFCWDKGYWLLLEPVYQMEREKNVAICR